MEVTAAVVPALSPFAGLTTSPPNAHSSHCDSFPRTEAPQSLQGRRGLPGRGLAGRAGGLDRVSGFRCAALGACAFLSSISLLGFPIAVVMAWVFDLTPEGVKLDADTSGSKRLFAAGGAAYRACAGLVFLRAAIVPQRRCRPRRWLPIETRSPSCRSPT